MFQKLALVCSQTHIILDDSNSFLARIIYFCMERESNSSDKERVIQVGHRIEVLNERGFVRFIGSLETCETSALWVGIEWDNPTRGKHDGTYNGKKYFHCIRNKGSFIKLEQLEKIPRRSFVEALMDKYCFDNLEQISHASNKFFGNKEAQFVGFDKVLNISPFEILTSYFRLQISLRDSRL